MSSLNKWFEAIKLNTVIVGPEDIARVFLFFCVGHIFFPTARDSVPIGWLAALEDLEIVGSYDWGSTIPARIYYSLHLLSRCRVDSMNCFWQLILVSVKN